MSRDAGLTLSPHFHWWTCDGRPSNQNPSYCRLCTTSSALCRLLHACLYRRKHTWSSWGRHGLRWILLSIPLATTVLTSDQWRVWQGIMQMERQQGGRLVDKPRHVLYEYGGGSLCVAVNDLCVGWRCKLNATCQVRKNLFTKQNFISNVITLTYKFLSIDRKSPGSFLRSRMKADEPKCRLKKRCLCEAPKLLQLL